MAQQLWRGNSLLPDRTVSSTLCITLDRRVTLCVFLLLFARLYLTLTPCGWQSYASARSGASQLDPAAPLTSVHVCGPPAGKCDFSKARQVGATKQGITVRVPLKAAGTYFFACQLAGHCAAGGMNVKVTVARCASAAAGFVHSARGCCCVRSA